jgi:hypothetical protein
MGIPSQNDITGAVTVGPVIVASLENVSTLCFLCFKEHVEAIFLHSSLLLPVK